MKSFARILLFLLSFSILNAREDPLPSWNEGSAKKAILEFVRKANDLNSSSYIPLENRIATFDLDGTLLIEKPLNPWRIFSLDQVKIMASSHPEWKIQEPFKTALSNDSEKISRWTKQDWIAIFNATHTGITTEAYAKNVEKWIATAMHPRYNTLFSELAYQPMVELLAYFRSNGYKTYIFTASTQEFIRIFSQSVYGIPPEQVFGSSFVTHFEYQNGNPVLMMMPKLFFDDNSAGKPIGINLFIGKRPSAACGNSDGDREMLEWTQGASCAKLMMLVNHDDPVREYSYYNAEGLPLGGSDSLSQSLMEEANMRGWTVISMKRDWKRVFAFEKDREPGKEEAKEQFLQPACEF